MRKVLLALLALLLITAMSCATEAQAESCGSHDGCEATEEAECHSADEECEHHCLGVYACPMFCEGFMTTDKEARCEACGMFVSPIKELYVCENNPDIFTLDPETVCPGDEDCKWIKVEKLFVCPNDPEEIFVDEDAVCSECGTEVVAIQCKPEDCEHEEAEAEERACCGGCAGGH